jgi:hypothetical protein
VALQLRKHGIRHVRPLLGGFYEWKKLGFPLVEISQGELAAPGWNDHLAADGPA